MSETITDALEKLSVKLGGEEKDSETIVDALKQIYSAYGGTGDLSEADTISEMIDEITKVASSGGGGGGSSDFTTAELTVTNTDKSKFVVIHGTLLDEEFYDIYGGFTTEYTLPIHTPVTVIPVLYEGWTKIFLDADSIISTSGNITGNLQDGFTITGDCSIVAEGTTF